MSDHITTKPFRSQSQWRMAFARGLPFARRWAHETPGGPKKRFHKLPVKVSKKAITTKPPNYGARAGQVIAGRLRRGSSGQFESAGAPSKLAPRKRLPRRVRKPPKTEQQRAQEQQARRRQRQTERAAEREQNIAKTFSAIGLAEDAADSLKRLAAGEAVSDDGGLVKMGLAEQARDGSLRLTATARALMNAAERGDTGAARDAKSRAADHYAAGQERTAARQQREQERAARQAERERRRAEQGKPKKGGSSGSKQPERRTPAPRIPRRASRTPQAMRGGSAGGGGSERQEAPRSPYADLAERLSTGDALSADEQQTLIRNGLARRNRDGALSLTMAGRGAIRGKDYSSLIAPSSVIDKSSEALHARQNHSDMRTSRGTETSTGSLQRGQGIVPVRQVSGGFSALNAVSKSDIVVPPLSHSTTKAETYGGRKRSTLPDSVFAGPDRSFPIVTAQDVRDAVRSLGRTKHDKAAVRRGIIRRARAIGAMDALPETWRGAIRGKESGRPYAGDQAVVVQGLARVPHAKSATSADVLNVTLPYSTTSFAVYKDAQGRYRWVAYSSNAYRDRDQEIVSTKALEEDCARADASGAYGPLRWWHVGGPVGKGWDLGDCDFNAMHGRVLVESGTFKSAAIGAAVARAAPSLQMSIGFTHDPSEPDRDGVFHHIRRFERSLVPIGRAANPFTRLIVKETHMDTGKQEALKASLGDAVAAEVLAGAEQTQKDADAAGVAYKADDPWAALGQQIAATLKAVLAPAAPEPAAEVETKEVQPSAEAKAEMMDEEEVVAEEAAPVEEETDPGEMTYEEFVDTIRAVMREEFAAELKAQLSPLAGALDIEKKVGSAVASLMQPYQTKDDARAQEVATLKQQLREAQQRLVALEGDVPNAFQAAFGGYRASSAVDTVLKEGETPPGGTPPPVNPAQPTEDDPFADIKAGLFGSTNGRA